MTAPANITTPDYKNIPHAHRLPVAHREVVRTFSKLSRASLISLAQQWLAKKNREFCRPYLASDQDEDEGDEDLDAPYNAAHSYEELQETYKLLAACKGGRKEAMDRLLEGDWRTGISMYQLATAEIQHLLDHPTALRWTAKRLARIPSSKAAKDMEVTNESEHLPRFQAQTFMMNLAKELTPLMKAHYLLTRIKTLPITILRVYIHDSPYSSEPSLAAASASSNDGAKAVFFIWPNGSPFVYVSLATHLGQVVGDDGRHLRDIVLQAIPKAFSRASNRYQLTPTNFTARSLSALLAYRGPGKSNAAAGGWSIFADHSFSQNALDFIIVTNGKPQKNDAEDDTATEKRPGPGRPKRVLEDAETPEVKRRKAVAEGRFGSSAKADDGQGIERFEIRIDDPFPSAPSSNDFEDNTNGESTPIQASRKRGRPSQLDRTAEEVEEIQNREDEAWVPAVSITFQGSHVFAGIRELVEQGVVDGEKMPGWMTGEAGVTVGAVKDGRIKSKGTVPGV
jgi:central kinetochore subunit Mis15/CHL4